jgi:hypothetical protein
MVPRSPLPLYFLIGDHQVGGETLHCDAGAAVLVLTSCSAELGIELRSVYLAGEGCEEVLVAESAVVGPGAAELSTRALAGTASALVDERRRLLYDHLQRLQDLALDAGRSLSFAGIAQSASRLDPLAPSASFSP